MIGPGMPPPSDWGDGTTGTGMETAAWRERERRQRSIRLLMMFLLMLLLMDNEEQNGRKKRNESHSRRSKKNLQFLSPIVFERRKVEEETLKQLTQNHVRYKTLVEKNGGKDVAMQVLQWAEQRAALEKDEFVRQWDTKTTEKDEFAKDNGKEHDEEHDEKIFHYPWNTTGFYRGEWQRQEHGSSETKEEGTPEYTDAVSLERPMLDLLKQKNKQIGVFLLPQGREVIMRDDNNLTSSKWDFIQESTSRIGPQINPDAVSSYNLRVGSDFYNAAEDSKSDDRNHLDETFKKPSGRAAFQLFTRSVPTMNEISLIDGFIKLYDSNMPGYSSRKDILMRVRGVLIHAIGRISLVSNTPPGRAVLVLGKEELRRKLLKNLNATDMDVEKIRDDALALFSERKEESNVITEKIEESNVIKGGKEEGDSLAAARMLKNNSLLQNDAIASNESWKVGERRTQAVKSMDSEGLKQESVLSKNFSWSDIVIPYPFVHDDEDETIRRTKTPAARRMPPREQLLERNAGRCEFEVNMNVQEVEWTVGSWRKLVARRVKEVLQLDPANAGLANNDDEEKDKNQVLKKTYAKVFQDQALAMTLIGSIESPNCQFTASLNVTALRTDWEHTTGKAINYSFYMMLTCLAQIMALLRQLLHTQAQSAATKVSLLCIGWQTVLDALLCLGHIYLSLAMQPLFTAFASVAFFKLLIFCVIEMKYMALIIQARNNSNGGNSAELLRRQVAMLHLRFYVALFGSFMAFFYAGEKYRLIYILALYSFWVPQIIQNIITEAKHPLHNYYVYGMSLSRLVAPLYIFAVPNNFLKEVYPESPTDLFMCEVLLLWIGIQTAILIGQGRYGARFMIPARFLPPKFDYSRPIPTSMIPPGAIVSDDEVNINSSTETKALLTSSPPDERDCRMHTSGVTTRNRIKGSRATRTESMTCEPVNDIKEPAVTLDCVICYNSIDVQNRRAYMLAPCDHIFHKDCLVQWMDIKMECPVCRTELPTL